MTQKQIKELKDQPKSSPSENKDNILQEVKDIIGQANQKLRDALSAYRNRHDHEIK